LCLAQPVEVGPEDLGDVEERLPPRGQALPELAAEGGQQRGGGFLLDAVHETAGLERFDGLADALGPADVPGVLVLLLGQVADAGKSDLRGDREISRSGLASTR
jgi:hypothetical protein